MAFKLFGGLTNVRRLATA